MRILHYFLGFPPYRTGGMTKFAYDLMNSQKENHEIIALWPGKMTIVNSNCVKIKKKRDYLGISNYEIINPLPVPLDEGIKKVDEFIKKCNIGCYFDFLKKIKPDAVHIHTLMGLHEEFVDACNSLRIKTVYTTHDYFGICPIITLFKNGNVCDRDNDCRDCINCNHGALSINKIRIMQSPLYRSFKNSWIVKILRKKHREQFFEERTIEGSNYTEERKQEYKNLRSYYISMLEHIDSLHFNSTLTKEIFLKYVRPKSYKVINISHKSIKDNRSNVHVDSDKIRFTFLASSKPYKGFFTLKKILDEIYEKGQYNFELNIFFGISDKDKKDYININEKGFKQSDLPDIFSKTDILVAPSIWYETFGYTILEALSYGVPVVITNRVGARDIVGNAGVIVDIRNQENLKEELFSMDKQKIEKLRNNIQSDFKIPLWEDFVREIEVLYK